MIYNNYVDIIQEHFEKKKSLNPSYSLRAFARDLGMQPSQLSSVLKGNQGISYRSSRAIAKKLKLRPEIEEWFCSSVGYEHARGFKERLNYQAKIKQYKEGSQRFRRIEFEYFNVISEWYHFAILELTYVRGSSCDPNWYAKRLGISLGETLSAIKRMKDLELIREENGKLIDSFKFLATPEDTPSESLKKFNSQLMQKALKALDEQEVNNREMSSNVFAFNKEHVKEFKDKIRSFRRGIESDASKLTDKDSVYCLSMQFFELTE